MITIGAQLFTLRTFMQNECDIRRSLKKVAEIAIRPFRFPLSARLIRTYCATSATKTALKSC